MNFPKRIFDILLSICFLIIFLPVFLILPILIKLDSNGPIIFKSLRIGQHNKNFFMYKFRSMIVGTELIETEKFTNIDNKITKIGSFLRRTSLDELPQIFNVLLGQMSLVGPRPAIKTQVNLLNKRTELKISDIKPGITGLAQINGRDILSESEKLFYDNKYLQNYSILLDIKILIKTFYLVFSKKDIIH